MLETVFSSFALVGVSEMGDKTQLLAFSLAARFKKPWPIMAGILVATLLNHALASSVGLWVSTQVSPRVLGLALGLVFIAFGFWTLKPDTLDDEGGGRRTEFGPFLTTTLLFFIAEMGDKTQLATVALGARFSSAVAVSVGTTLGMLLADGLAVFLGDRLSARIRMDWLRRAAAALFFLFGALSAVAGLAVTGE
jgi:putative Ca2+/H+ antiporter (TMEM165/GDT1 family)